MKLSGGVTKKVEGEVTMQSTKRSDNVGIKRSDNAEYQAE
jgi:hypothetical protein